MRTWVAGIALFALIVLGLIAAVARRSRPGLSINEIATLTLSLASLGVALLAYLQTLDNSDMKTAISQLTYLGKQTYRQASATRRQVRELKAQTSEMGRQTGELHTSATSSVSLAGNAAAQLQQRERQFSLEQRPLIRWDQDSDASKDSLSDDASTGLLLWNYGLRNSGKSIAYNVVITDGISLWGKPFVETRRTGGRQYAPGETSWATAAVPVDPALLPIDVESKPALRVKISYRDVQGNRYEYLLCHRFEDVGGAARDCSQSPIASLPAAGFTTKRNRAH